MVFDLEVPRKLTLNLIGISWAFWGSYYILLIIMTHHRNEIYLGQNLAEALISRGLAFRIRHRQDDDNRSSQYDALIMAEQKAQKAEKGCFSKNLPPTLRVSELDGTKARASFAFLKGQSFWYDLDARDVNIFRKTIGRNC